MVRVAAPWQSVWLALVISLIVFCLLTSGNLVSTARSMPIGPVRSVALPLASGVDRFANFLSLNRPADTVDHLLGRSNLDTTYELPPTIATVAGASTTVPAPTPLRVVSTTMPLVVMAVGDSMAQPIGEFLTASQTAGEPYQVSYEAKVSSGLARPDYFNWPARLVEIANTQKPEALVMVFGGNDAQELTDPFGDVLARPGTAEWERTYAERVGALMDVLQAENRRLVWLLPPRMLDPKWDASAVVMHRVIAEQAASRPWVLTVDTAKITAGPDGGFAEFIKGSDGQPVDCRQQDGVHFTVACSKIVVAEVRKVIDAEWEVAPADASGTQAPSNVPLSQMATTAPTTIPGP